MKRLVMVTALFLAVLSVPVVSHAKRDMTPTRAEPPFTFRPLVFERYPLDFEAFDNSASDNDGPFDFSDPTLLPFQYSFGDERGGSLTPEPNHAFYGMDPNTDVYAGISGVIYDIRANDDGECDSEVFISPDSPLKPGSWILYFDHIRPTREISSQIANGPIRVTPDTIIGKVGIQTDCVNGKGWLEIGVFKDRPDTSEYVAQFCPTLFMPTANRAPQMPELPPISTGSVRVGPLVRDTSPPRIVSRTPTIGQRGVDKAVKLKITFNEPVKKTTNPEYRVSIVGFNPQNVWNIPGNSSAIRLSPNKKTATINLAQAPSPISLTNGQMYAVKIDQGTFADLKNNWFAGIMESGDWYFSVGPSTVLPSPRTYVANRAVISTQIANIMLKYNRLASDASGHVYDLEKINSELAGCSISKFSLRVASGG